VIEEYLLPKDHPPLQEMWSERLLSPLDRGEQRATRYLRFHRMLGSQIERRGWDRLVLLGQWATKIDGRWARVGEQREAASWDRLTDETIEQLLYLIATHFAFQISFKDLIPLEDGTLALSLREEGASTREQLLTQLERCCGPQIRKMWSRIEKKSGLRSRKDQLARLCKRRTEALYMPRTHPLYRTVVSLFDKGDLIDEGADEEHHTYSHESLPDWKIRLATAGTSAIRHRALLCPYFDNIERVRKLNLHKIEFGEGWLYETPQAQTALLYEEPQSTLGLKQVSDEALEELALLAAEVRSLYLTAQNCHLLDSGKLSISPLAFSNVKVAPFVDTFVRWLEPDSQELAIARFSDRLLEKERSKRPRRSDPRVAPLIEEGKEFLLPKEHPLNEQLERVLTDPRPFIERALLERAGFHIASDDRERGASHIMVASHPDLPQVVLKTFALVGDHQLHYLFRYTNYLDRLRAAKRIRACMEEEKTTRLFLPQKWLYRLPRVFSDPQTPFGKYVLIAERVPMLSGRESFERYHKISEEMVDELIRVVLKAHVGDIGLHNLPFTTDGKIAFIDTERSAVDSNRFVGEILGVVPPPLHDFARRRWEEVKSGLD